MGQMVYQKRGRRVLVWDADLKGRVKISVAGEMERTRNGSRLFQSWIVLKTFEEFCAKEGRALRHCKLMPPSQTQHDAGPGPAFMDVELKAAKLSSFVRKASVFNKKKIYIFFIMETTVRSCYL